MHYIRIVALVLLGACGMMGQIPKSPYLLYSDKYECRVVVTNQTTKESTSGKWIPCEGALSVKAFIESEIDLANVMVDIFVELRRTPADIVTMPVGGSYTVQVPRR